jgi:hypothetical protein
MGYETRIEFYAVKVMKSHFDEVETTIFNSKALFATDSPHWMIKNLLLKRNRALTWESSSIGKWKRHEGFIKWLAIHCESGFVAFWSAEGDGAAWAYEFDGSGKAKECSARRVSAMKAAATRARNRRERTKSRTHRIQKPSATKRTRDIKRFEKKIDETMIPFYEQLDAEYGAYTKAFVKMFKDRDAGSGESKN